MIRVATYNGRNYVTVNTVLKVQKTESLITVPFHIRVDITELAEADREVVLEKVNKTFNHIIAMKYKQTPTPNKPWWKKLFS